MNLSSVTCHIDFETAWEDDRRRHEAVRRRYTDRLNPSTIKTQQRRELHHRTYPNYSGLEDICSR